jgi:hypothetical protein
VPSLGRAFRASLSDYYFHSLRLVPSNLVWGIGAVVTVAVALAWPVGGFVLLSLLALPTAACFRVAARVVRLDPRGGARDVAWPYGRAALPIVGLGASATALVVVLGTNLLNGVAGGPAGWLVATLAGWGLVAVWSIAVVAWPLLVDPARPDAPIRERLRLAATLLLVDPIRVGGLAALAAAIAIVSLALTAAILTVSVSFLALVACRVVYPVADRLAPPAAPAPPTALAPPAAGDGS